MLGITARISVRVLAKLDEVAKTANEAKELALKKTSGVTAGSYKPVDEVTYQSPGPDKTSAVILPKTPKMLEYEAQERLRKASADWGIKPTKDE